jgi:hypothetical protein
MVVLLTTSSALDPLATYYYRLYLLCMPYTGMSTLSSHVGLNGQHCCVKPHPNVSIVMIRYVKFW